MAEGAPHGFWILVCDFAVGSWLSMSCLRFLGSFLVVFIPFALLN